MAPIVCSIPRHLAYPNLAESLAAIGLPFDSSSEDDRPVLDLTHLEFCDPSATVALAGFAAHYRRKTKRTIELNGWKPDSYLSRVGFKDLAGYPDDYPMSRRDDDRLTSIIEVATAGERGEAREHVLDVLDIAHSGCRLLMDYCLEEILRNVEDHADSPVNALVQAQYYQSKKNVVVTVGDTGYGILWNMRQRHSDLADDSEALRKAMQPGMSGRNTRKGTNAGLGLTVSSSMVARIGGMFQIASGDAVLEVTAKGQTVHNLRGTRWPGVLVTMSVPRDDSLDWEGTFTRVLNEL